MTETFEDFVNYREENNKLIYKLISTDSYLKDEILYIYSYLEYALKEAGKRELTAEEDNLFVSGFHYFFEKINYLKLILEHNFNNNFEEMIKLDHTLKMLLTIDEILEVYEDSLEEYNIKTIKNFKDDLHLQLENKENIDDYKITSINTYILNTFDELDLELETTSSFFYDLNIYLGLISDDNE